MAEAASETVTLTQARMRACLEAAWEIDALARVLPDLVPMNDESSPHFVVRGMAGRLLRLAHVVMSGVSDESVSTEKLEAIIHLERGQG